MKIFVSSEQKVKVKLSRWKETQQLALYLPGACHILTTHELIRCEGSALHWSEFVAVLEIASCNRNTNGNDCSSPFFSSYEDVNCSAPRACLFLLAEAVQWGA